MKKLKTTTKTVIDLVVFYSIIIAENLECTATTIILSEKGSFGFKNQLKRFHIEPVQIVNDFVIMMKTKKA